MNRKKYLINKSMQIRYMSMVAVLAAIICILTGWTVYMTMWGVFSELAGDHPRLYDRFTEMNSLLAGRLLILIAGGAAAALVITLFISHRVAGPLYRMDKILNELASGSIPLRARFRKKDEFIELAAAVNSAIERLEEITDNNEEIISGASGLVQKGAGAEAVIDELKRFQLLRKPKAGVRAGSALRDDPGFTITELLVSLAIMMILAGLMLTSLIGARQQVGRTVCLNELRQIGIATFMYAQDYGKIYPEPDSHAMGGRGRIRILGGRPTAHGLLFPLYLDRIEVFGCPSSNYAKPEEVKNAWIGGEGIVHSAYAYRGLSGGLTNHRIDSFERAEKPALLMDYNNPESGKLNHGGEHVNILSAGGAAASFPNAGGKLSIPGSSADFLDAAFIEADRQLKAN